MHPMIELLEFSNSGTESTSSQCTMYRYTSICSLALKLRVQANPIIVHNTHVSYAITANRSLRTLFCLLNKVIRVHMNPLNPA